jgi:adenylate cyclase class IV
MSETNNSIEEIVNEEQKLDIHVEFESKYRVEQQDLILFKKIVEILPNRSGYLQVDGPDHYFTKEDGSFARYRKPDSMSSDSREEVTIKVKPEGAKNNIIRKEINWKVTGTSESAVREGLSLMGYTHNFSIYKMCYIYFFEDATLVFYTVFDTTRDKVSKGDSFIEIEVSEENIHTMTEKEAWDIILKYEKVLEPIGINPQKRLRKSLYEMYYRK